MDWLALCLDPILEYVISMVYHHNNVNRGDCLNICQKLFIHSTLTKPDHRPAVLSGQKSVC